MFLTVCGIIFGIGSITLTLRLNHIFSFFLIQFVLVVNLLCFIFILVRITEEFYPLDVLEVFSRWSLVIFVFCRIFFDLDFVCHDVLSFAWGVSVHLNLFIAVSFLLRICKAIIVVGEVDELLIVIDLILAHGFSVFPVWSWFLLWFKIFKVLLLVRTWTINFNVLIIFKRYLIILIICISLVLLVRGSP